MKAAVLIPDDVLGAGEVWWADQGDRAGSEPGYRRPVVVVQEDALGKLLLKSEITGLPGVDRS